MRLSSVSRSASLLLLLGGAVCLSLPAQTFAAASGAAPTRVGDMAPSLPSALPAHHRKTEAPLIYARVRNGIYSVDGMVGKVQLNYDVKGANYLYLFVPGVGTALVSLAPSTDAVSMPAAFHDGELTLHIAGHTLDLTGVESLVNDSGKQPTNLYVRIDRESWKLNRTPMLGYGMTSLAPYEWPGALPQQATDTQPAAVIPVPVPVSLLPRPVSYQVPAAALR